MVWPAGEVSPLNIPGWRGFPLRARMTERFPTIPVRLHNDAVCMAVGEHWRGAGRNRLDMLGMVVSTGIGGGLVLDGRLVDGAAGNAGHIGHVVVEPDGPQCACGGQGCLEAVASGPSLVRWATENGWQGPARSRTARGRPARTSSTTRGAGTRSRWTRCARAGSAIGMGVASAAHLLDLETVAVGGGLSQAGPLLFEPLEESLRRHADAVVRPWRAGRPSGARPGRGAGRRRGARARRRGVLARALTRVRAAVRPGPPYHGGAECPQVAA